MRAEADVLKAETMKGSVCEVDRLTATDMWTSRA